MHRTECKEMIHWDHFSKGPGWREGTRKGGRAVAQIRNIREYQLKTILHEQSPILITTITLSRLRRKGYESMLSCVCNCFLLVTWNLLWGRTMLLFDDFVMLDFLLPQITTHNPVNRRILPAPNLIRGDPYCLSRLSGIRWCVRRSLSEESDGAVSTIVF